MMLTDNTLGTEQVQRELCTMFNSQINTAIAAQASAWAPRDAAWASDMGISMVPIDLEPIASENIVPGHRPSLIDAPLTRYPNLSVMAYDSAPSPNSMDEFAEAAITVTIEVMVKAGPYDRDDDSGIGESFCDSRIHRTVDAVYTVLTGERSLDGLVVDAEQLPVVGFTPIFVRNEDKNSRTRFFWQGAQLTVTYKRLVRY